MEHRCNPQGACMVLPCAFEIACMPYGCASESTCKAHRGELQSACPARRWRSQSAFIAHTCKSQSEALSVVAALLISSPPFYLVADGGHWYLTRRKPAFFEGEIT